MPRPAKPHFSASRPHAVDVSNPGCPGPACRVSVAIPEHGIRSVEPIQNDPLESATPAPRCFQALTNGAVFGLRFIPAHRPLAIGHQKHRQRDGAIHFRHVVVVDLLPLVADGVVIGIIERHTQRLGGHAGFGERKIVALRAK